jgi:UDP-N-acetylglucosamine 4,6-dehydratase
VGSLRTFVGDVRDRERLKLACQHTDAVIHAAALKRVDAVVNESVELDKTNVQGTLNVLHAALECGVRKVLFVSSDKAVMPCNVYGATKMLAEAHTVGFNAYSMPRGLACAAVRYGNVFGSTGSILRVWRQAITEGRPLPVTSADMTRFHITQEQAVSFCLTSLMRMVGGEIFVPELPAYRLKDLALAMLSAAKLPTDDWPGKHVALTGLRPGGEKLGEIMLSDEEPGRTLWQEDRYLVMPAHKSWSSNTYRGAALQEDPHLTSEWPARWLTIPQLEKAIEETP